MKTATVTFTSAEEPNFSKTLTVAFHEDAQKMIASATSFFVGRQAYESRNEISTTENSWTGTFPWFTTSAVYTATVERRVGRFGER
jgi:hypothetical protein